MYFFRYMHILSVASFLLLQATTPLEVTTIFGSHTITEPLLIELIEHPGMQRLKEEETWI